MEWLILVLSILAYFVYKFLRFMQYWQDKGVPSAGLIDALITYKDGLARKRCIADLVVFFYNEFPNTRYSGCISLNAPQLTLRDPELIKQIIVKDFDNFVDRRQVINENVEPLWGKNLFQLRGDKWRDMRATLSPAFTSLKMKNMYLFISECAQQFTNHFYDKKEGKLCLEMKDIFTRCANDIIASTAFGIKCDSLGQPENQFYMMGKDLLDFTGLRFIKMLLFLFVPFVHKVMRDPVFSGEVKTFFRKSVKETIEHRKKENIVRLDMIHLLVEAQKGRLKHEETGGDVPDAGFATVEESNVGKVQKKDKPELDDDDLVAQAVLFLFAGFDTLSSLMSFMAYELALNPDVQEKLQKEIDETLEEGGGEITYEVLLKMKYLDMVVSETLRKWPAVSLVERICTTPYTIVPKKPNEVPVLLETNTVILVPVFAIHRDPVYYPDPEKFDPERFNDENKHNIQPFTYLPFGMGPRNCIGSRFALLESKTIILHLLSKFNLEVNNKTQIPIQLNKTTFSTTAEKGIWLNLVRRKNVSE